MNIRKTFSMLILSLLATAGLWAQQWTADELAAANTAAGEARLTPEERETIKYLNLARLYPRKFADLEVMNYYGGERAGQPSRLSDDRLTLIAELYVRSACAALAFAPALLNEARCLADEQSRNGETGHKRHQCSQSYGGECCSYGYRNGREIALQLLIDDGIEGLGHRRICLDPSLGSVAVAIDNHPQYDYCAVLDFAWVAGQGGQPTPLRYLKLADVPQRERQRFYKMMTAGLDPTLCDPRPSGKPVFNVVESVQTKTSTDGAFLKIKTETRTHADGVRQIITTTTSIGLDGNSRTTTKVTIER